MAACGYERKFYAPGNYVRFAPRLDIRNGIADMGLGSTPIGGQAARPGPGEAVAKPGPETP